MTCNYLASKRERERKKIVAPTSNWHFRSPFSPVCAQVCVFIQRRHLAGRRKEAEVHKWKGKFLCTLVTCHHGVRKCNSNQQQQHYHWRADDDSLLLVGVRICAREPQSSLGGSKGDGTVSKTSANLLKAKGLVVVQLSFSFTASTKAKAKMK